ncbi:MAG: hypothetical protein KC442_24825, partial [Thermomicrobiales bacterium]|nr:hypothetical protein [Thermomicrobiales bacterium]
MPTLMPRTPAATGVAAAARSRRRLLGSLAVGVSCGLLPDLPMTFNPAAAATAMPIPEGSLVERGICYDTGTAYVPGAGSLSLQVWDPERVAREMAVLHNDLHCNAVAVFGSKPDRLREGAEIALREGLRVWLQPRPIDADAATLRAVITEVASAAEALRQEHGPVGLNLGVELTIFSEGIIPGATYEERIETLVASFGKFPAYNAGLNELLASLRETAREVFSGPLTYGSGEWEVVDWTDFDAVGADLYLDARNRATYREQVQTLHSSGKPVLITEFGCCTYEGAEDAGGSGYTIVDWEAEPPRLNGEYVRSEQVQAETIISLLEIYVAEQVHGAYVFTFIEPEMTYDPDPLYDLDMASFGIVKALPAAT